MIQGIFNPNQPGSIFQGFKGLFGHAEEFNMILEVE